MAFQGPAAPVVGVALCLALLTGCGESERYRARERVDAYISGEQDVMRGAEPEFRRANETFVAYARGEISHEEAATGAEEAVRSIGDARDGVSALDPPAEAQDLHDELVGYLDLNVDVARETERLAAYVPAVERVAQRVNRANRELRDRLDGEDDSGAQADALDGFQASVGSALGELRALDPPAVLGPAHARQAEQLAESRRLARSLREALVEEDAERVARLLKRFREQASANRPPRLAGKQAFAQYTRRLADLTSAYTAVREAQVALARSLSQAAPAGP
jgi:hypothetical protein